MTDRSPDLGLAEQELEQQVRATLTRRAVDISGPPPELPVVGATDEDEDEAIATLSAPPPRRGAAPSRRWMAAGAAAAIVLLVATAAVVADRNGGDEVRTTAPPSPDGLLPAGADLATSPRVFRMEGETDPETVAGRYLGWRLAEPERSPDEVADGLDLEAGEPVGAIVPVSWHRQDGAGSGTVFVKRGGRGSDVVAATAPGVDLSALHLEGTVLRGHVEADGGLPGPALVDVTTGPTFQALPEAEAGTPGSAGYGRTARGDEDITIETEGYDPTVAVRFADDDRVVTIAEVAFDPPEPPLEDHAGETTEERLRDLPPDPRCVAAERDLAPLVDPGYPGGQGTAKATAADPKVFELPSATTPEGAVVALGDRLGVSLRPTTRNGMVDDVGVVGGRAGAASFTAFTSEQDGRWDAAELQTPEACHVFGIANVTPDGAPNPTSNLAFSTVVGARSGQLWYRTSDGSTRTVRLDEQDIARGTVTVPGEFGAIDRMALVARNEAGDVVLVQTSSR
jgi:hypothetical protein